MDLYETQKMIGEFLFYAILIGIAIFMIRAIFRFSNMKNCPYCDEQIKKNAVKCRFCHSQVDFSTKTNINPNLTKSDRNLIREEIEDREDLIRGYKAIAIIIVIIFIFIKITS